MKAETIREERVEDRIALTGRFALDAMRVHQISARVSGRLDRLDVFEGAPVRAGQQVGLLFSPDYVSAQREYLLARNAVRALSGPGTADLLEDARATLAAARSRLQVMGASSAEVERLDATGAIEQHLVLRAPISGVVIRRNVDPGAFLGVGDSPGTVADLSSLWFVANAYESDLPRVRIGQGAELEVDGAALAAPLRGRVSFVAPVIDPQTHTVGVRIDVPNPRGALKPEMFARATLFAGVATLPVVPRRALIQDGADAYLVIERDDGRYERVMVDARDVGLGERIAIRSGAKAGERVVVDGSVLVEKAIAVHKAK